MASPFLPVSGVCHTPLVIGTLASQSTSAGAKVRGTRAFFLSLNSVAFAMPPLISIFSYFFAFRSLLVSRGVFAELLSHWPEPG